MSQILSLCLEPYVHLPGTIKSPQQLPSSSPTSIMSPKFATLASELHIAVAEHRTLPALPALYNLICTNRHFYHRLLRSLYQRALATAPKCHPVQRKIIVSTPVIGVDGDRTHGPTSMYLAGLCVFCLLVCWLLACCLLMFFCWIDSISRDEISRRGVMSRA
jgi:hypothetical protein